MANLSHTFNILKWGARLSAAAVIVYGISQINPGIKDSFNEASLPDEGKNYELIILTPQGSRTYSDQAQIRTALDSLPMENDSHVSAPASPQDFLRLYRQHNPLTQIMDRLIFSESGNNPDAVSHTGAKGLGQFVTGTFLEQLYYNKDQLPETYNEITDNVIRYRKNQKKWEEDKEHVRPIWGYKVKTGYPAKNVTDLAHDPIVSEILATEYVRHLVTQIRDQGRFDRELGRQIEFMNSSNNYKTPDGQARIAGMREHLGRPMTATDLKTLYVFGLSGGLEALVAYADPVKATHKASDYTSAHVVRSNPDLFFYHDSQGQKHHRSLAQLREYFVERVGNLIVPQNLQTPNIQHALMTRRAP